MIVIVIIGLIYTLAVSKLKSVGQEKLEPSFLNLKEYLSSFWQEDTKSIRLLCLDACEECKVLRNGEEVSVVESFFDDSVELYRYDVLLGMQRVQKAVYFNEENVQEDVCFSFSLFKDGISEQVFASYNEKVYDYTTYFSAPKEYDSLDELLQTKEQFFSEVMQ